MSGNLISVIDRIQNCGNDSIELVNSKTSQLIDVPVFCDNRACDNPACMGHRSRNFLKKHIVQIDSIQNSMISPKAWIFTGYVVKGPLENWRFFISEKTLLLYNILKKQSSSEFSIHFEAKPKLNDFWYLHWHVVMGGLKDYHFTQKQWGRYVKYEKALKPREVDKYVSKYASKTPEFKDVFMQFDYLKALYKLHLHRFSTIQGKISKSDWFPIDLLYSEIEFAYSKDVDKYGKPKDYHPFLDNAKKKKKIVSLDDF